MKPIHINPDTLTTEKPPIYKKMSLETPIGTVESDSGNHMIDILTVIGVIGFFYIGKVLIKRYFNG